MVFDLDFVNNTWTTILEELGVADINNQSKYAEANGNFVISEYPAKFKMLLLNSSHTAVVAYRESKLFVPNGLETTSLIAGTSYVISVRSIEASACKLDWADFDGEATYHTLTFPAQYSTP